VVGKIYGGPEISREQSLSKLASRVIEKATTPHYKDAKSAGDACYVHRIARGIFCMFSRIWAARHGDVLEAVLFVFFMILYIYCDH
jgi:hypothetical protein